MTEKKTIAVVGATGSQGGGLVRAILNDKSGEFTVRALTRDANSKKAKALSQQGAEVVEVDLDNPDSLASAFKHAYGAYCVTFFWEHLSPEKELAHAKNLAGAAAANNLEHVIWSTLEDTRKWIPVDDDHMPTLMEKYKVPHFDAKGEANRFFTDAGVPTTFQLTSYYWDNLIFFAGPQKGENGKLVFNLPMDDKKLPGIAAEDIGKCAYGIFKNKSYIGEIVGLSGEHLTGRQMTAAMTEALGQEVVYNSVPHQVYRDLGFPGAVEFGNMFQFQCEYENDFCAARDIDIARSLNPSLQNFSQWLSVNKDRFPV